MICSDKRRRVAHLTAIFLAAISRQRFRCIFVVMDGAGALRYPGSYMDAGPPTTAVGFGKDELLEGTQSRVDPGTYMAQRHHGAHCNYQESIADTISHRSILVGSLLSESLRSLSRTVSKSGGIRRHGNGIARLEMVEASIFPSNHSLIRGKKPRKREDNCANFPPLDSPWTGGSECPPRPRGGQRRGLARKHTFG